MSDPANRYRPQTFEQLVGMDKISKRIRGHFKKHKDPKGFLITGATGSGKTTIARIMGNSYNCSHSRLFGHPCRECRNSSTYYEINASDITGKDDLRAALGGYTHAPMPGMRRRVYILDEAHMLSKHSQNLLLKFIEDSPKRTKWIICSTSPETLINTLYRRLTIYRLPSLDVEDIKLLVKSTLKKLGSDKSSTELAERLMEKEITSSGLVMKAIEKYADTDASADEASDVVFGTKIDTYLLCRSLIKGDWEDVSKMFIDVSNEDMGAVRRNTQKYLKSILIDDKDFNKRTDVISDSILMLHNVRDEIPAVVSVLYKICKYFKKYSR